MQGAQSFNRKSERIENMVATHGIIHHARIPRTLCASSARHDCSWPAYGQSKDAIAVNAMSGAERQARFRAKKAEQECPEVRGIYAHKLDHAAIKVYAAKVTKKRTKAANV